MAAILKLDLKSTLRKPEGTAMYMVQAGWPLACLQASSGAILFGLKSALPVDLKSECHTRRGPEEYVNSSISYIFCM